jgi:hypothetical protein
MKDYLATRAWAGQTGWLQTRGDDVWDLITDKYEPYEVIDGARLPTISASAKYRLVYCQTVLKNVAAMHAVHNTGSPQVVKRGAKWVLCDPAVEAEHWDQHRQEALRLAAPDESRPED